MADDNDVSVSHDSTSVLPVPAPDMGYGTEIHTTTVTDANGNSYEGVGWTEDESNDAAGKAMNDS